jgi:SAM-dependent methyltransferase
MMAAPSDNPFETEAFWGWFGEFGFSEDRWEQAPGEVENLLALAGLPDGTAVLDLACGPGRHSIELARRGYRVTGVDRTPAYIEEARSRAIDAGLDVEFVVDDMRSFKRPDSFDLAINLFSSFGYFDEAADDRRAIENAFLSLKSGGRLVMDIMGRETLAMRFQPIALDRYPDGTVVIAERRIVDEWRRLECTWTRIIDGVASSFQFGQRIFGAGDLEALLINGGFDRVDFFGGLDGTPYDHTARRLVAVAHR